VSRRALALALTAGAALALAAAPGSSATRTLTLEGWHDRALAFSGDRLLWTEAATVRVDPRRIAGSPPGARRFDYYRAETFQARLDRRSRRFAGAAEAPVSVRTSIARMGSGNLAPTGDGGFVMVPESRRFAPPVIWCCDRDGIESVIASDGRDAAPLAVAGFASQGSVVYLALEGGALTASTATVADPDGTRRAIGALGAATPGLVSAGAGLAAWIDPADPASLRLAAVDPTGIVPLAAVALPGPAVRLRVSGPRLTAVAVRAGAGVQVIRVDARRASARRVWSGRSLPRVAVGGGTIAIAEGRRVLAARGARAARRVSAVRRRVDAIGVDGRRIAWVERAVRKGARVGVVRIGRLR
jgi:hypothetical protein